VNTLPSLKWLVPLIFVLTLVAAGAGLAPGDGQPYPLTSFRGEQVDINARGLYYWDTVSIAAQAQANDLVTLVLGLPLLTISFYLTLRGSLRGRLLLTGTLAFILYTYMSVCFGIAYNKLFLVYVALFGLSLFAFILSMMSFDLKTLPARFSEKLPRRGIAALLLFTAAFLSLAWLGRIAPTIFQDMVPALDNTTSMTIQAMDLGIIIPLCVLSGILLLRRRSWGYLLASVSMMKFLTMTLAVSVMGVNMVRAGVPTHLAELVIFPSITLVNAVMAAVLLKGIDAGTPKALARSRA
jgi:hypothetical protein